MQRIIEVGGDEPVSLHARLGCLVATSKTNTEVRVPFPEIAVVVVGAQSTLSGSVLGSLGAFGAAVIAVDARHVPVSLTLPLVGHTLHAERLRLQIEVLPRIAPAAWAQVVRAKIDAQAALLADGAPLRALAARVAPGDPANIEAQAARLYWRALLGDDFRRDRSADGANRLLNYGYAVLRAIVARAVCAAGFHPALGLHHAGRDAFALADDLMEPARPIVDRVVRQLVEDWGTVRLDRSSKQEILGALLAPVAIGTALHSLFDAYGRVCSSLHDVLCRGEGELWLVKP